VHDDDVTIVGPPEAFGGYARTAGTVPQLFSHLTRIGTAPTITEAEAAADGAAA
jgi:hypothetical protein